MSAKSIDCKKVAERVLDRCKEDVAALRARGIVPKLAMVRVGESAADLAYERGATRAMEELDIAVEVIALPGDVAQEDYIREIQRLNDDPSVHGILPFLPLETIDAQVAVGGTLLPEKDVDAATPANLGKVLSGDPTAMVPCTAAAILEILDQHTDVIRSIRTRADSWYDAESEDVWTGLKVCIVNYSDRIGRPLAALLTERYALVTVLRRRLTAAQKDQILSEVDVVIAASPKKNSITATMIKEGALVIDASVIREKLLNEMGEPIRNEETGKPKVITYGCCEPEVAEVAGYLTPVPGVGAITSAMLAANLVKACTLQADA